MSEREDERDDERDDFQGSVGRMLTVVCNGVHRDRLVEMIEEMSVHVRAARMLEIIEGEYGHLSLGNQALVIDSAIPEDICDGAALDPQIFGEGNREMLEQSQYTVRSGNDSYDSVEKTDSMVQTEMARRSLRQRPVFLHHVLVLYQRWSERWKRENPEDREDSASPGADDSALPALFRERSQAPHRSRDGSREPSAAASRPPSRDSREHPSSERWRPASTLCDLLDQMKTMC